MKNVFTSFARRAAICAATVSLYVASLAQGLGVSGRVMSEGGDPLPGVAVVVKGSAKGVATDADGRYRLTGVPEGATIVFSCVGFAQAERKAGQVVDVFLADDSELLGEVVVSTQKRQQTSIEVPVAVSSLSGKDVALLGVRQVDDMADFVPGFLAQIQSPNNPGYVIRGVTSDDGAAYSQPRISVFQD